MTDIGPSLTKLRKDWRDDATVDVPTGMIARRVLHGAMARMAVGETLTIERVGERSVRIAKA